MLTLSLTRRQLYELYYEGVDPTIRLIEDLIEQLADFERILGGHQQRIIDAQHERNERLAARLKRVTEKLARTECEVYALTRRIREAMRDLFGCPVSPGTIDTARHRCAAELVGVEEQLRAGLRAAEVLGADETGLRVAGRSHWIHVARTDRLTHYTADTRRGKLAIDAVGILPQCRGVCVRDGWTAYDEYRQVRHGLCNAHRLRELVCVEEVAAEQQQWTRPLAKLFLEIKAEVERAKGRGETELSEKQLATFTARYETPSSGHVEPALLPHLNLREREGGTIAGRLF